MSSLFRNLVAKSNNVYPEYWDEKYGIDPEVADALATIARDHREVSDMDVLAMYIEEQEQEHE